MIDKEEGLARLKWVDGIKGIACLGVMMGHISGIVKYSSTLNGLYISKICQYLFNEAYWLVLFYIISGFLLSYTSHNIRTVKSVFMKILLRVIRFSLLIYVSSAIVWLIQNVCGFMNTEFGQLINNSWLKMSYQQNLTAEDLLCEPFFVLFRGEGRFIPVYYVLHKMLIGAIIVVIMQYALNKLNVWIEKTKSHKIIGLFVTLGIVVILFCIHEFIIGSCVLGMISNEIRLLFKHKYVMIFQGNYPLILLIISFPISLLVLDSHFHAFIFMIYIIVISSSEYLNAIFSSRQLHYLGNISFGIYALHWPITCSIGMRMLIKVYPSQVGVSICIIALLVVIVVSAIFFAFIPEKMINRLIKYIKELLINY